MYLLLKIKPSIQQKNLNIKQITFQNSKIPDEFTEEFQQAFKGEITPIFFLLLFFLKIAEGLLPMNNSVYEPSITLIPKLDDVTAGKANKCLSWTTAANFSIN